MLKSIAKVPFETSLTGSSEVVKMDIDIRQNKYARIAVEKRSLDQDNQRQETNLAIGQSLVAQANSNYNNWRK
jgi:hypothetical protein